MSHDRYAAQHEAVIANLAQQTNAAVDVIRRLYQEEVEALEAGATVKSFIGVIAGRRVKQRLRATNDARQRMLEC